MSATLNRIADHLTAILLDGLPEPAKPPVRKPGYRPTFHRDYTVSFWSVPYQQWQRRTWNQVSDRELAAMPSHHEMHIRHLRGEG